MVEPITAVAAAVALGAAAIGSGYAEAHIGPAVAGMVGEKPETFGKGLVMLLVPETIVVLGFVLALMLVFGI